MKKASVNIQDRTGKPGVLQSMGSQGVRHDWLTAQQASLNRYSHEQKVSFLLGKYLWGQLLGHGMGVCNFIKKKVSCPEWLYHFALLPAMFDFKQFLENTV